MSISVTTSTSLATSTTLATTSDDTQTLDSYATEQSLLATSVSDDPTSDDLLAFVLGGEATAVGEEIERRIIHWDEAYAYRSPKGGSPIGAVVFQVVPHSIESVDRCDGIARAGL
jgi:hypothetical protein